MGNIPLAFGRKRALDGTDAASGRPSKRAKIGHGLPPIAASSSSSSSNDDGLDDENATVAAAVTAAALPPEAWALVMNCLDCRSVLSCAATSRSILRDAAPLVTTLHVFESRELDAALARRHRDVRDIYVYSLLGREDEDGESTLDDDSAVRIVPFLSRFPRLERVFLGGRPGDGDLVESVDLMKAMPGFFRCGGRLTKDMRVFGLGCLRSRLPWEDDEEQGIIVLEQESSCRHCDLACRSFPLKQVINFENRGSAYDSGKPSYVQVCLSRSQIESHVLQRGGHDLLKSDFRFRYLLGRGRRHEIRSDEGDPLYIAAYSEEQRDELERVASQFDAKAIGLQDLRRSIMRSFVNDDRELTPPNKRCFLAEESFFFLRDELGLAVDEEYFYGPTAAHLENLPHIARALSSGIPTIQEECTNLLRDILRTDAKSPIQQIVDLDLVPKLVHLLKDTSCPTATAEALSFIADEGTEAEVQVAFETAHPLPPLIGLLKEEMISEEMKISALSALAEIFLKVTDAHVADAFKVHDPTSILSSLIATEESEEVQKTALVVLVGISEKVPNSYALNAVSDLAGILLDSDTSVAKLAAIALIYSDLHVSMFDILICGTRSQVDALVSQGCVPVLCGVAQKAGEQSAYALEVLSRLLSGGTKLRECDKISIESMCMRLKETLQESPQSDKSEEILNEMRPHFEKVALLWKQDHCDRHSL